MKWVKWGYDNKNRNKLIYFVLNGEKTVPTTEFNFALGFYALVTALNAILYVWLDFGKLLATYTILHNLLELVLLLNMHSGGKITSKIIYGNLPIYLVTAASNIIFLEFPKDALWFKLQGNIYLRKPES